MCLVDHQTRAVALAKFDYVYEWRYVALHREDAVDYDEHATAVALGALQRALELVHAVVPEGTHLRLGKQYAVEDRGVIGRVHDHGVLCVEQRSERADVCLVAGGEDDRVVGLHPFGELALELEVQWRGAVQQARACKSCAVAGERVARALHHPLVAGQAQVVVGGEHDAWGALHLHDRHRRRLDRAEVGHQVGLAGGLQKLFALVAADLREHVCGCEHLSLDHVC